MIRAIYRARTHELLLSDDRRSDDTLIVPADDARQLADAIYAALKVPAHAAALAEEGTA